MLSPWVSLSGSWVASSWLHSTRAIWGLTSSKQKILSQSTRLKICWRLTRTCTLLEAQEPWIIFRFQKSPEERRLHEKSSDEELSTHFNQMELFPLMSWKKSYNMVRNTEHIYTNLNLWYWAYQVSLLPILAYSTCEWLVGSSVRDLADRVVHLRHGAFVLTY